MALIGLRDDYTHDGRVLVEMIKPSALPGSLTAQQGILLDLARVFKMINAPFGDLGLDSLVVSTAALTSNTPNDATYTALEAKIADWRARRDWLASKMKKILEGAAFDGQPISEERARELTELGQALLDEVSHCAHDISGCVP
jgi:hypothetical protein